MQRLFETVGFEVTSVQRLPIHHGQIRVFVQRSGVRPIDRVVEELANQEVDDGLGQLRTFEAFANNVETNKFELRNLVAVIDTKANVLLVMARRRKEIHFWIFRDGTGGYRLYL